MKVVSEKNGRDGFEAVFWRRKNAVTMLRRLSKNVPGTYISSGLLDSKCHPPPAKDEDSHEDDAQN